MSSRQSVSYPPVVLRMWALDPVFGPTDSYTAVGYAILERKRGCDEEIQDRHDKEADTQNKSAKRDGRTRDDAN